MFSTARVLIDMWTQRWQALREDEGASTIEYIILVVVGLTVAGIVAGVITTVVNQKKTQIK